MENNTAMINTAVIENAEELTVKNPFASLPPILNAAQLGEVMGISRAGAYNLMHREDFPTLRVGSRRLVATSKLIEWIDKHSNNGGDYIG